MCTPPPIDMCAPRRIFDFGSVRLSLRTGFWIFDWQTAQDCNGRVDGFINRQSKMALFASPVALNFLLSCLGAEAVEIICAAQLTAHSPGMIVIEIKIRQMRKVDVRHSERGMITWIVFRQGDIGAAAHVSRKKRAVKIDNLQSVVSEEQPSRDAVERQRFSKKDVIHSIGAIDRDLEMCVRATAKLI